MTDDARPSAGPADAERRQRLLGVKLRALVADHLGRESRALPEPSGFPSGAALVVDHEAWVLVDGAAGRSIGAALAWAVRNDATSLHLVADSDTGLLARRAERFDFPISVWFAEERTLLAAVPEPLPAPRVGVAGTPRVRRGDRRGRCRHQRRTRHRRR